MINNAGIGGKNILMDNLFALLLSTFLDQKQQNKTL
jgi:hypothetical protein